MVLVVIRQAIVHEHPPVKVLVQCEGNLALAGSLWIINDHLSARINIGEDRVCRPAKCIVDDVLFDLVGEEEEGNTDRNEGDSDNKESGQNGSRGQNGLPGGKPLLFEGGI